MKRSYFVVDELGLHARPASLIVHQAGRFDNEINMIYKDKSINAKSIMGLMTLAVTVNTEFTIEVNGDNCELVFEAIENILNENKII